MLYNALLLVLFVALVAPASGRAQTYALGACDQVWANPKQIASSSDASGRAASTAIAATQDRLRFWTDVIENEGHRSFTEIAAFVSDNPAWPRLENMRQRAEEAISDDVSAATLVSWFSRFPPLTSSGRMAFADALSSQEGRAQSRRILRELWIEGSFSPTDEAQFVSLYGAELSPQDHRQRLDRLLWDNRLTEARRQLALVDGNDRALGSARIALQEFNYDGDTILSRIPPELRIERGLVFDRVRWLRQKNRTAEAAAILASVATDSPRPELWARERILLARRAVANGDYQRAYDVVSKHDVHDGVQFADAEWLAGWIALRFLRQPRIALGHFATMYDRVKHPNSRGRAAYWAARASAGAGDVHGENDWYATALGYPTSFYGQLAAVKIGNERLSLPSDPAPSDEESIAFGQHDLVQAACLLTANYQTQSLPAFIQRLGASSTSAGWQTLTASLARSLGRPDLAVAVGRQAVRSGHVLIDLAYPVIEVPDGNQFGLGSVEDPLILAVARQESSFDPQSVSRAGARGVMQLMPDTGRRVAAKLGLPFSVSELTADASHNMLLGKTYLADLIDTFEGSYVLALGGYNAGPNRVREWLRQSPYPRDDLERAIDWIEQIPLSETRDYVHRVLENLQIYRHKMLYPLIDYNLIKDITR
jgi:soluble lytic murein transglycosylase